MNGHTWRTLALGAALLAVSTIPVPARAQIAGENVNMVSGTEFPGGDPFLQRQNEPTMAVSSANPNHLLAGANDYRSVDIPNTLPCDPATLGAAEYSACLKKYPVISDGWLGVFKSLDGGQTWKSTLLPGFPQDGSPEGLASPLHGPMANPPAGKINLGLRAAADPVMRAGTDGMFYFAGLNFQRDKEASRIFLARYVDLNDSEAGSTTALRNDGAAEADSIRYVDTRVVAESTLGFFMDKPWLAVDVPRQGALTCTIATRNAAGAAVTRSFKGGTIYVGWTQFSLPGEATGDIMLSYSRDCGATWVGPQKLNGTNSTLSQGVALAIEPITGRVYAAWRRAASGKQGNAIMVTRSEGRSRNFSHARVLYSMTYPFDQPTNFGTFRSNAFPAMAISTNGNDSWVHVAWSQRLVAGGNSRVVVTSAKVYPRPVGDDDPDDPEDQDDETRVKWSLPKPVDAAPVRAAVGFDLTGGLVYRDFDGGHQFMPALTFGQGRLVALYYDTRLDHTRRYYRPVDPNDPKNQGRFYDEVVAPVGEALEGAGGLAKVYNDYVSDAVPNPDPNQPGFDPLKQLTKVRHTLDVRLATARIDGVFDFAPSVLVSQFPFGLRGDEGNPVDGATGQKAKAADGTAVPMTVPTYDTNGSPTAALTIVDKDGKLQLQQQLQHNPGGFPLFKNGQVAFMGDYIDIQGPSFVPVAGGWNFAWQYTDTPTFHAVWASNQDVRAPPPIYTQAQKSAKYTFSQDDLARGWAIAVDPDTGKLDYQNGFIDWTKYTPVRRLGGKSTYLQAADPEVGAASANQQASCVTGFEGSRDQNIYSARISEGIYVFSPQNVKPLPAGSAGAAGEARAFVVAVRNPSARALTVAFSATDPVAQAGTGRAVDLSWKSTFPGPSELPGIELPAFTTVHRTLFVRLASGSTSTYATVDVKVAQTGCTSCQTGYVTLNPPVAMGQILAGGGLSIGNADSFGAQFIDARLTDPSWSNPSWSNGAPAPSWSNPSWSNSALAPSWSNPSWSNAGLTNVNFAAPSWSNPSWSNPSWSNPSWSNPSWSNPSWSNPSWSNPSWSNTPVSDLNYEVVNTGNTTTSYHVKVTDSAQSAIAGPVQLLATKRYETPTVLNCSPKTSPHFIPVVNVPDLRDAGGLLPSDQAQIDPAAADGSARNATITLAPGERAQITIRAQLPLGQMADLARRAAPAVVPAAFKPTGLTYAQARAQGGSAPVAVIGATATTTGLTYTPSASAGPGYFTATVAPATATGTVTFVVDGTRVAAIQQLSGGQALASFAISGVQQVTAHYAGDMNHMPSVSSAVGLRPTSLSFSDWSGWANNPTTVGTRVYLATSVDPGGAICTISGACDTVVFADGRSAHGPTGTIAFYDGTRLLSGPTPIRFWDSAAYMAWLDTVLDSASWAPGVHSIRAVYSGDDVYAGSEQVYQLTVLPRTPLTVTLAVSPNPATTAQAVTFRATITGAQIPLLPGYSQVTFAQFNAAGQPEWSGFPLPSGYPTCVAAAGGGYTCEVSGTMTYNYGNPELNAGTHVISATYGGDLHYDAARSASVTLVVNPQPLPATVTTISTSGQVLVNGPSGVTLNASVSSGGSPVGSGNVQFLSGSTVVAEVPVATNGTATFTTTAPPTGLLSLTAHYTGTASFAASTSSALSQWIILPPMPTNRAMPSVGAIGGRVYVLGGFDTTYFSSVDVYDPATRTWSVGAPMAATRFDNPTVTVGSRMYAVGGGLMSWQAVEAFDPATNAWTAVAPMNAQRQGHGAAAANGKIYVMGGHDLAGNYLTSVEEYDPVANTWTTLTGVTFPNPRTGARVESVGGKLYALGGYQNPRAGGGSGAVGIVDEFDPVALSWRSMAAIPTARDTFGSAVVGTRIYVMDGRDANLTSALASVEELDPATNTWRVLPAPAVQRFELAATAVNGTIYAAGGLVRGTVYPPGDYWWGLTASGTWNTATAFEPYTP